MSYLSDLRTYIETQVALVDSSIIIENDPFGDIDVNNALAQKLYKLVFGEMLGSRLGNYETEEMQMKLIIFSPRKRDENAAFYDLYEKAIEIKNNIIRSVDLPSAPCTTTIFFNSLFPEKELTDDNAFKITINFTVRTDLNI